MKKLVTLFALAAVFVGCQQKQDEVKPSEVNFSLSEKNIEVKGLSQDCMVDVDNAAKTVVIYADYSDKENIKALEVSFKDLEEGVEVNYSQTFNYAQGSQKVVFVKEKKEFPYDFSVVLGEPVIKFASFTVAGADALSGEVKLSSSQDLTSLVVEFVVSPADTKVFVGDKEIASGDAFDFSDKLNGVTFVARVGSAEKTLNVKVVTTGISEITRLWGCYYKPFSEGVDAKWFGSMVTGTMNVIRTVAMNDEYVFLSKDAEKDVNNKGGVYAISISDPSNVKLLPQDGIADGTRFFGITTLANTVLAATFTMGAGANFKIYAWEGDNVAPKVVLEYVTPENMRLGDRIMAEGNWKEGKIWLYDSTSAQKLLCFTVSDFVINPKPTIVDLDTKMGNYGIFYPYKDNQYVWGGGAAASVLYTVDGTDATSQYTFPTAIIASPTQGIRFFTFNEENYMAYVVLRNNYFDGQFRVSPLGKETLAESIDALEKSYAFYLGDPNATEDREYLKNANGSGEGAFRIIDGKYYYAAFVPGTGLSLFEIK